MSSREVLHSSASNEWYTPNCKALGGWMCHDGTRYKHDETAFAYERVRVMVRDLADEGSGGKTLKSARTVSAVETLARSDQRIAVTVDDWDSDI